MPNIISHILEASKQTIDLSMIFTYLIKPFAPLGSIGHWRIPPSNSIWL